MKRKVQITALATILLLSVTGCTTNTNTSVNNEDISISHSSVMYVGGEVDGKQNINQSRVDVIENENNDKSIVMVPGHGLSSYLYTSTPDGRPGWNTDFSNSGYNTYAMDTNNLAISGVDVGLFQEGKIDLKTWDKNSIWKTWGFGDEKDVPYEDTKYPVEYIDQLYSSFSPQVIKKATASDSPQASAEGASVEGGTNETVKKEKPAPSSAKGDSQSTDGKESSEAANENKPKPTGDKGSSQSTDEASKGGTKTADLQEVNNIIKLLEETGPTVLMAHSMGGVTAAEVVRQRPDLVEALVLIEPVGSPTDKQDLEENFKDIPYLAVYGDYIESRGQTGRYEACQETAKILTEFGTKAEVITLTELGMDGNTHLMMQDTNSSEISDIIIKWLDENVK